VPILWNHRNTINAGEAKGMADKVIKLPGENKADVGMNKKKQYLFLSIL
jgi:hypothetical protein